MESIRKWSKQPSKGRSPEKYNTLIIRSTIEQDTWTSFARKMVVRRFQQEASRIANECLDNAAGEVEYQSCFAESIMEQMWIKLTCGILCMNQKFLMHYDTTSRHLPLYWKYFPTPFILYFWMSREDLNVFVLPLSSICVLCRKFHKTLYKRLPIIQSTSPS